MTEQLKEFEDLIDMADTYRPGRGIPEPPDEAEITRCIQIMLSRQCIYANQHGIGPSYRVLATPQYQSFFRKYFAAMGLEFHHDIRSGLIALKVPAKVPRFDHQSQRLRKDETAVLLALRVAYEEAFKNKQYNELGIVETTTDELFDKLEVIGGITIDDARLREILTMLKRKGIIDQGDLDPIDRVTPLTILPGIEIVVPATYVERVMYVAAAAGASAGPSGEPGAGDAAGDPVGDGADTANSGVNQSEASEDPRSGEAEDA